MKAEAIPKYERKIIWWKDVKFLVGCFLVIISFALGLFGKGLFFVRFYEPFYRNTGLSLWAFSWIILIVGGFLLGAETIKIIRQSIQNQVIKTVNDTYNITKGLPKKGFKYTRGLIRRQR